MANVPTQAFKLIRAGKTRQDLELCFNFQFGSERGSESAGGNRTRPARNVTGTSITGNHNVCSLARANNIQSFRCRYFEPFLTAGSQAMRFKSSFKR